jgi:hypothetical protein
MFPSRKGAGFDVNSQDIAVQLDATCDFCGDSPLRRGIPRNEVDRNWVRLIDLRRLRSL